jgi:membrane protein implicated in regulation of membrane protease activity
MSWRSVFGLDGVEFVIFWAVSVMVSLTLGVLADSPELSFLLLAVAGVAYAVLRRRALRNLPDQVTGQFGDLVAQLQDDQQASTEYFERKIAELEERVDFAERLLARGQDERLEVGHKTRDAGLGRE